MLTYYDSLADDDVAVAPVARDAAAAAMAAVEAVSVVDAMSAVGVEGAVSAVVAVAAATVLGSEVVVAVCAGDLMVSPFLGAQLNRPIP